MKYHLTRPATPLAIQKGRYRVILPPAPTSLDHPIDYVYIKTPPPGKRERITERPPKP